MNKEEKNILIHGAIHTTNFGDCLFAHIFYEQMKKYGKVDFYNSSKYGIGEYLKKELNYEYSGVDKKNADILVYMSGGYLGNSGNSIKESVRRYFKYFRLGRYFQHKGKKIVFLGVGGGPIDNLFLRKEIVKQMNYASKVNVRDEETKEYYVSYGVQNEINVTTDTALIMRNFDIPELDDNVKFEIDQISKNKKIIFLHIFDKNFKNCELEEKIIPSLNRFLSENEGKYAVVVGTDYKCSSSLEKLSIFEKINAPKYAYKYGSTLQFCALLKYVDTVITTKLHVGIVSSVYEKAVVSLPTHKFKTYRYYKQIGESERCKSLSEVTSEDVYTMINTYANKKILISDKLFNKAYKNLEL